MDTRAHDGAASAALIATVAALLDPLEAVLKPLGRVCVAFSGGVDSSVVLAVAARVLGAGRVLAFTAVSETYRDDELAAFKLLAAEMLAYGDEALAKAIGNGTLTEVVCND